MKKILWVLLLCLLLCGCQGDDIESKGEIVIGSDRFEPFSYSDNGEMKGIDVEIAREAFKRMGYTPVFKLIEWQKKDEHLRRGEIDCIWGCFSMNGREDLYDWVGPYVYSRQVIAVKSDSDIYTLDDLKDKIVAVQATSKAEQTFLSNDELKHVRYLYTFSTINEVFTCLSRDYVDAIAGHEAALKTLIKDNDDYRYLDESILVSKVGIAFKKGYDEEFLNLLTKTLGDMLSDGTIKRIVETYGFDKRMLEDE